MFKIMRNKSKSRVSTYYSLLLLWVIGSLFWYHYYYYYNNHNNYQSIGSSKSPHSIYDIHDTEFQLARQSQAVDPFIESDFKNNSVYIRFRELYNASKEVDKHSSVYDNIFKNHAVESVLASLDFSQRCDLYFRNIFAKNHNWAFNPNANFDIDFGRKFDDFSSKNAAKLKVLFDEASNNNNGDGTIENYEEKFAEFKKQVYQELKEDEIEQKVVDELAVFRLYNKCYVTNNDPVQKKRTEAFIAEQRALINGDSDLKSRVRLFKATMPEKLVINGDTLPNLDNRIYPWLSFDLPLYERWTGEIYHHVPNMREILGDRLQPPVIIDQAKYESSQSTAFFKRFKSECNGKGIVMSFADKHVDYAANLIRLLRALKNSLPIQIVYFDNLNDDSKRKIVTAARENFSYLPQSFEKVSPYLPKDYLDSTPNGLPKQEIWFVNAATSIDKHYRGKFSGYANKLLATLFNSFNEFMLVDADTALLHSPESFFQLQGYKDTGTFFFKDRAVLQKRDPNESKLFKRVAQSSVDKIMFDVDLMTNHTFHGDFFQDLYHQMESGVVLFNRQQHFNSILMVVHLNFLSIIRAKSWGDKELYWLGLAFNGDENYHFNKHGAAAIGEVTLPSDRKRPDGTLHHSKELCSPHPGHISEEDNHTLLWINSGFRYCHQADKVDYEKESRKGHKLKFLDGTAAAFKEYYYNPLRIKNAIVPPRGEELTFMYNESDEPLLGWSLDHDYCERYMWCAYSSIGGLTDKNTAKENTVEGTLITYSEKERAFFDYYGDIWIGME
ncbi:uncharacterized protein LODBEIA_P53270 [Lodderomyces beijingensis]|uniref:Alpha-1,3-mannosyltransferase n=1 Tax=Lodderomyces beijingensis TaxID=1775926 RepID=A0ABP0ZTX0_9ASCO